MTKALLATLFAGLAVVSARADLIWSEPFNYLNGPIIATGTNSDGSTNWVRHSGSSSPSDAIVSNHKLQNSATGGTLSRADDVHRNLTAPYTNSPTVLYASFTVNCTNLPAASNYFAHFTVTATLFQGRVFGLPGSLPGTWRLGVSGAAGTPNKIYPVDLAPNTDYQVVVSWDPVTLFSATLWVNPLTSADYAVISGDAVTAPPASTGFGFRQSSSFSSTFFNITNVAVATTFDEAATAVWPTAAVAPVVASSPQGGTNFVGDTLSLKGVGAGQGLASLTYTWRKNGVDLTNPGGNTNVFTLASAAASDTGNYELVVTTGNGLSATSAVAFIWVTNSPVPPTITQQPTNTSVYFGQTATLSVSASGTGPFTYAWYYNGAPATGANVSGADTATLTIANVQTNNGTAGTYRCDISNIYGTRQSANAVLSATPVPLVTIGYLRTLVDPVFFLPTNTTALYRATGIVTTWVDMTGGANAQFYMQDDTGGITVFVPGGAANLPQAGDSVTVTGPLGAFNGLLELNLSATDPSNMVETNSHGNALPAGVVLPFNFTNGLAVGGVGNAVRLYQSAVVTFTNVWFPAGFTNGTFSAGSTYLITNSVGEAMKLFLNSALTNWNGVTIPQFAWTVTGPMGYFLGNTVVDRSSGFEFDPSRPEDIVTETPLPVTIGITLTGNKPGLNWVAQPYMSYSIYRASDVTGPYVPLATGLTFNSTGGHYTDSTSTPDTRFYKITSP